MNMHIKLYVEKLAGEKKSEHTIKAYVSDIEQMLDTIAKEEKDITYSDMLKWKTSIINLASATINRKIIAANRYFDFLMHMKIISENPVDGIENVHQEAVREHDYVPMEEAKKMLDNAKNSRDAAIIAVYLTTGMRVNELINLTLDDYNAQSVNIITKGRVKRHIVFNNDCRKYVDAYLKERKICKLNNLFVSNQCTPMRPEVITRTLKVIANRSNVSTNISNHSFRHTHISYMTDKYGISAAQHEIGHSSPVITARYAHNTDDQIVNMINSVSL